jgi:hypothetical protein
LGSDGGRLNVAVFDTKNRLREGVQVVLVPDVGRRHRRDQYRIVTSGEDGEAHFRGIPPGSYNLFSWEALEPNAHLNTDYVSAYENLGVSVRIASGDNAPVSVRVIPKAF